MNCNWIAIPTGGEVLLENFEYVSADTMQKNETTIVGGVDVTSDDLDTYHVGWVMLEGKKNSLVARFEPEKARADVTKRLAEMGHEITIQTAAAV